MTEPHPQLRALVRVRDLLERDGVDYWLFGGWAVDFYVGAETRPHDDVDIAVWLTDIPRIAELLVADGWRHVPHPGEDGGTGYERDGVRVELTYLEAEGQSLIVPLRDRRVVWSDEPFGNVVGELQGVRARLVPLDVIARGKAMTREDPRDAAKDRADLERLSKLT